VHAHIYKYTYINPSPFLTSSRGRRPGTRQYICTHKHIYIYAYRTHIHIYINPVAPFLHRVPMALSWPRPLRRTCRPQSPTPTCGSGLRVHLTLNPTRACCVCVRFDLRSSFAEAQWLCHGPGCYIYTNTHIYIHTHIHIYISTRPLHLFFPAPRWLCHGTGRAYMYVRIYVCCHIACRFAPCRVFVCVSRACM